MNDYDDEDIDDVAMDSSDDEEETIRWAYQDAKSALLSEESNAVACFQRVLTMDEKKGSKTVWGFKALKHLVIANIRAKDFNAAADRYRQLLDYSGVVPSAEMEPAIEEITALAREPKAALMICRATYDVKKPTMTWMARCITLLSDGRHAQCPELLAEALESASTLRNIVSHATHLDDATQQFHLLSVEAITAELRFRRRDFEEVHAIYLPQRLKSSSSNPRAVAAIYEIFAKVLLSPFSSLKLDRSDPDPHFLATSCLEKALKLYPSTDAQAHIRCWRYLTVNRTLGGTTASSNLAIPDAFKPEIDAVIRLLTLYIDDHGDQFLAAWEEARDQLADPFLQEFFDAVSHV
ncbi:COP9 signalosome complex subunit 2-like isoform 2 [Aphelenchoides avenae]|nr:COP9 signalosome complex subunit 2-like isoform 2 [Aphelenchus avenae]